MKFSSEYKSDITNTNHREAASTLIKRERIRKTTFFGLAGSFQNTHHKVHDAFQILRRDCPFLSIRIENKLQVGAFGDEETPEVHAKLEFVADDEHAKPRLLGMLKRSEVTSCEDKLVAVIFPGQLPRDSVFNISLRIAYEMDYKMRNVTIQYDDMLKWGTRLTFTTRFVFSPNHLAARTVIANYPLNPSRDKRGICFNLYDFVWVRN